jgi:Transcription factor subunit Med10 of Mediator complex
MSNSTELERELTDLIELLRQTMIVVEEYEPSSQDLLTQNVYVQLVFDLQKSNNKKLIASLRHNVLKGVKELDALQKGSEFCRKTSVPLEIVEFVDRGHDPDLYTQQQIEVQAEQRRVSTSKVNALSILRHSLYDNLASAFPEDTAFFDAHSQQS